MTLCCLSLNPDLLQLTDQSGTQQRAGQAKGGGSNLSSKEKIEAETPIEMRARRDHHGAWC